jgi:hypothetical protein
MRRRQFTVRDTLLVIVIAAITLAIAKGIDNFALATFPGHGRWDIDRLIEFVVEVVAPATLVAVLVVWLWRQTKRRK